MSIVDVQLPHQARLHRCHRRHVRPGCPHQALDIRRSKGKLGRGRFFPHHSHCFIERSDTAGLRHYLCEALSFQCRYVPIGLLERLPAMSERAPAFEGRDGLGLGFFLFFSLSCQALNLWFHRNSPREFGK